MSPGSHSFCTVDVDFIHLQKRVGDHLEGQIPSARPFGEVKRCSRLVVSPEIEPDQRILGEAGEAPRCLVKAADPQLDVLQPPSQPGCPLQNFDPLDSLIENCIYNDGKYYTLGMKCGLNLET